MKKAIKTVCVAGGALFGLYTIFYAGMAVLMRLSIHLRMER